MDCCKTLQELALKSDGKIRARGVSEGERGSAIILREKNSRDRELRGSTPDEIIHRVYNLTHRFESLLSNGTMRLFTLGNGGEVRQRRAAGGVTRASRSRDRFLRTKSDGRRRRRGGNGRSCAFACFQTGRDIPCV